MGLLDSILKGDLLKINKPINWKTANEVATDFPIGTTKFRIDDFVSDHRFPYKSGTVIATTLHPSLNTTMIQFVLPFAGGEHNKPILYRWNTNGNTWTEWREFLWQSMGTEKYVLADTSVSQLVNLDVGLPSPFYQLEDGLRATKQGNIVHLNGGLQHGINLKYQNIAKVPPGYEPKYKTPLNGSYSKASGVFVSIPLLLKPDGYIVMMDDRNDPATPTNMYVSGTWNIKS